MLYLATSPSPFNVPKPFVPLDPQRQAAPEEAAEADAVHDALAEELRAEAQQAGAE